MRDLLFTCPVVAQRNLHKLWLAYDLQTNKIALSTLNAQTTPAGGSG